MNLKSSDNKRTNMDQIARQKSRKKWKVEKKTEVGMEIKQDIPVGSLKENSRVQNHNICII